MSILFYNSKCEQDVRLRFCRPASGMSHCADGRRASGGAGRWAARGGVLLVNAQAYPPAEGCPQSGCPSRGARSTAARSASGTYHAAVAGRPPYRNGRGSGSCADRMSVNLTKYIRRRYISRAILCNKCLVNAQFDNGFVIVQQKGGPLRAA